MKKIIIDTSVIIDYLRTSGKKTLFQKLLIEKNQMAVSFITISELWAGDSVWQDKAKAKILEGLLAGLEIILPSASTLKMAGKIRAKHKISLLDAFIAASAIEHKLPLATLNAKDFVKIKGIQLI